MPTDHRERLARIRSFTQLVAYLRDELGWPIVSDDFEELTFEYTPAELGIDAKNAAKIQEIKRLRPLVAGQPWGIFFVKFEPKRLPVVALRRILGQVALKKRASANWSERQAWAADDLLFVSNYGEGEERRIAFAHFSKPQDGHDLPTLKVLGWDNLDTPLHLDAVARELTDHLTWPDDEDDPDAWRERWRAAFKLRHREVISTSKQLSERLAELARAIRDRIWTTLAIETESGPLSKLMKAFQTGLVHDLDEAGFADMYAQTIAYGLLSARITDPVRCTADDLAAHMRTNPFLKELMETFLHAGGRRGKAGGPGIDFDELGVSEVVELLDQANMEAVVLDFGDRNPQEDPVIHFYEHFLAAYDRKQKVSRGVFYTPRPVVSYIVRSVDELLRTEFGLADGLADTTTWSEMTKRHEDMKIPEGTSPTQAFVQILDPATGTGTFLVEVIGLIHDTMAAKWKSQGHGEKNIQTLWNEYVPKYLLPRLHGYELLMAPYAIAHLKIGLKLFETGYRFGSDERARVYLTNALEPARDQQLMLDFLPALAHEAEAVNEIKRKQRFTVIMGNPPYAAISSNLTLDLRRIVDPYRYVAGERIRERSMLQFEKNIQDDYVKFFAYSQDTIDRASIGVCSLITNHSYLDGPTLRGLRWNLLSRFDSCWFLDMHGNANKAEAPPEGTKDENVFDIRQGVAICALVKGSPLSPSQGTLFGELWGQRTDKYELLSGSGLAQFKWTSIVPTPPYYYLVGPDENECGSEWEGWPLVCDLFTKRSTGTETGFDDLLLNFSADELRERVALFASPSASRQFLTNEFDVSKGHAATLFGRRKELHAPSNGEFRPFQLRAYDYRWALLRKNLLKTNSFNVMLDLRDGAPGLVTTRQTKEQFAAFAVKSSCGHKLTSSYDRNYVFPLFTRRAGSLVSDEITCLDGVIAGRFASFIGSGTSSSAREFSLDIFAYVLAVLNARSYAERFRQRLKRDWPRVPLPGGRELFLSLVRMGRDLQSVHLMESQKLGRLLTTYSGPKYPEVGRIGWSDGTVWLNAGKTSAREGQRATKPGTIGFKGVTEQVWDFHIGGYQVCHKWLKDRKGRTLSDEDIAHYQKIVVALNETVRIMGEIDEVIEAHGGWPGAFQTGAAADTASEGPAKVVPFRPRTLEPAPEDRYVTCVPLVPLRAAAGTFSDPQHVEDDDFEWAAVESGHRLRRGMFVAQVVGKSMEPTIPDGAWCLFRGPVEGTRRGKVVLVQLRDVTDPETGRRYTVKCYKSDKAKEGDSWRHVKITLDPVNPNFEPIVLTGADEDEFRVIAELVEVLECKTASADTDSR